MHPINDLLNRSIDTIYPSKEALLKHLEEGKKLKIYLGIDPTSPHLHLGHAVNLLVLRRLQDLGHQVILLIGDFTAMIGDPTDKASGRQPLTAKQVKENIKGYKKQLSSVLRFSGKNAVKIAFNSKWLGKMKFQDVIELASHFTVQQMIERDMFQDRLRNERPIGLHEFLYPLMQGYDSVALDVDAELGGTDQTFNMLAGRTLLKDYGNKEKFVLTVKLLVNARTGKKMSKTEGDVINLDDEPNNMFGKVMASDDGMIIPIAELATLMPQAELDEIKKLLERKGVNPKDIKMRVAHWVVKTFCGEASAHAAEKEFKAVFQAHELPSEMPLVSFGKEAVDILTILAESKLAPSKSEARRLIDQGAVKIDGRKAADPAELIDLVEERIIQVGKRHFLKAKK